MVDFLPLVYRCLFGARNKSVSGFATRHRLVSDVQRAGSRLLDTMACDGVLHDGRGWDRTTKRDCMAVGYVVLIVLSGGFAERGWGHWLDVQSWVGVFYFGQC